MCIGCYGKLQAHFLCCFAINVIKVKAGRLGVHLKVNPTCFGLPNDSLHVNFISLTFADEPAAGVCKNSKERIIHRPDDTLRLFFSRKIEFVMHSADGKIQLFQDAIRQVERAVFKNIHLNRLENCNILQLVVECIDLLKLFPQALFIHAFRYGHML